MSPLDYIDDEPEAYYTPEGRLRLTIRPGKEVAQSEGRGGSGPLTNVRNLVTAPLELGPPMRGLSQRFDAARNALAERGLLDKLLGINGPRFQTWPERMVRSGFTLPHDVMSGTVETVDPYGKVERSSPITDLVTGRTSEPVIQRVQDLANFALLGSIPAAQRGALGTGGGRMTQPTIPKAEGPFYSAVENAVSGMKQDKMDASQWLNWLRNQPGVKQEELDWLGLEGLQGPMTKEQVLEHVRGHGPEIKEIEKQGPAIDDDFVHEIAHDSTNIWAEQETVAGRPPSPDEVARYYRDVSEDIRMSPENYGWEHGWEGEGKQGGTRYQQYQLPGGDNYREVLLTMPEKPQSKLSYDEKLYGNKANVYKSSHWDEPNILVHMRMNDRDIPGVGKTLHLEEVQSDWHQEGRKKGYKQSISEKNRPAAIEKLHDLERQLDNMYSKRDTAEYIALKVEIDTLRNKITGNNGVPDAPFKSTWADLALKRAISKAAREGYDAISWTPGEQQAARYDLSKQIDQVIYDPKSGDLVASKDGQRLIDKPGIKPEQLADYIGKEAADRILNNPTEKGKKGAHMLSGLDLKVGGEGMKAFYDKMLVDKANALAKKFGGKVEWKELPGEKPVYSVVDNPDMYYVLKHEVGPEGEDLTRAIAHFNERAAADAKIKQLEAEYKPVRVPVLRLTPKMKEAATGKGFPLFSSGLPFQFIPVDHDPFDDKLRGGDAT